MNNPHYMKKIIALIALLYSVATSAQVPPGYSFINSRYDWLAGKFRDGLHAPASNGYPATRAGVWTGDGQIMIDTLNHRFYFNSGGAWRRMIDTAGFASGAWGTTGNVGTMAGTNFIGTTDNVAMSLRMNNTVRTRWFNDSTYIYGSDGLGRFKFYSNTGGIARLTFVGADGGDTFEQTIQTGDRYLESIGSFFVRNTEPGNTALNVNGAVGQSAPVLSIIQDAAELMTVIPSGNVGINTTTPDSTLTVVGGLRINNGAAVSGYVWTAVGTDGRATWMPSASSRFGVSGEDDVASADRSFNGNAHTFQIEGGDILDLQSASFANFSSNTVGINAAQQLNLVGTSGFFGGIVNIESHRAGGGTWINQILIQPDSTIVKPPLGQINIDTLRKLQNGNDSMMTWNPVTGVITYRAIPSGGTLTASNGLTKSGNDIQLDDGTHPLSRDVTIDADGNQFSINNAVSINSTGEQVTLTGLVGSNVNTFALNPDSTDVDKRISYHTNINGSFTSNSLVSKRYVDSLTGTVSATPAGSNTEIQYNNAGSFGASANFKYDASAGTLQVSNSGTGVAAANYDVGSGNSGINVRIFGATGFGVRLGLTDAGPRYATLYGTDLPLKLGSTDAEIIFQPNGTTAGTFNVGGEFITGGVPDNGAFTMQNNGDFYNSGKLNVATGSNKSIGTATLSSGTITVNTTSVSASSIIIVTYNTPSGTLASGLSAPAASRIAGTSFVINSLTTAGVVNTLDNSTVNWWIIN